MLIFTIYLFFFFNDTATTEIYTLSLHDALPILAARPATVVFLCSTYQLADLPGDRSEEHTSELQSLTNLVCRLLLETKNDDCCHDALTVQRIPAPGARPAQGPGIRPRDADQSRCRGIPLSLFMIRPPPRSTLSPYTTLFR